jgi:hypothetical protein
VPRLVVAERKILKKLKGSKTPWAYSVVFTMVGVVVFGVSIYFWIRLFISGLQRVEMLPASEMGGLGVRVF